MAEDMDMRVSIALHPTNVQAIEGYNEQTRVFVADVESAFRDSYVTIGRVHDLTAAMKKDPTHTEANRVLIVGKEAEKQQDRLLRKMDAATANLEKAIAHTEAELSKPMRESAGQGTLNQEVRAYVRSLKHNERTKLINDALESGDEATLGAILGAQPFLSGLTPEERDVHVRHLHERQNPALVARLTVMRAGLRHLDMHASQVMKQMERAVGAPLHRVSAIESANNAAKAALNIAPTA